MNIHGPYLRHRYDEDGQVGYDMEGCVDPPQLGFVAVRPLDRKIPESFERYAGRGGDCDGPDCGQNDKNQKYLASQATARIRKDGEVEQQERDLDAAE